jgi:hypothetical protein
MIPTRARSGLLAVSLLLACRSPDSSIPGSSNTPRPTRYQDLVNFFVDWRAFQRPRLVDGVPDYTAAAMAAQRQELATWKGRLAAFDTTGWSIPQQVDYHIVRAELNGLDFDHRVLMPWVRNPAFYVTVFWDQSDQPAREGPLAYGAVELWKYHFPLQPSDVALIEPGIRAIPGLLAQAQKNLTGTAADLWTYGTRAIKQQSADLAQLATRLGDAAGTLKSEVDQARIATDSLSGWLEAQASSKTGPSGIGVANYDWYLKNVQLSPYTWQEEVVLMERELARAEASLVLEERANARLPQPKPIASAAEHERRFNAAVTEYMKFLKDHDLLTIRDDMDPALRARIGTFSPGPREFFTEIDYRDPEVMRTHGYHWFDLARLEHDPPGSPMRRVPLLYNIFNTRTEGHATGWEELMLQAGMFNARPRSRELIYILLAERAARALGDLRMQADQFTLEQAAQFASANTPRGWLSLQGNLVRGEQHLYLQQPAYGTSYLIGKIQIEALIGARKQQEGDGFSFKRFMDEFNAAGLIPASLLRWELTGRLPDDVGRMLGAASAQ